jgi:hypothetical protein
MIPDTITITHQGHDYSFTVSENSDSDWSVRLTYMPPVHVSDGEYLQRLIAHGPVGCNPRSDIGCVLSECFYQLADPELMTAMSEKINLERKRIIQTQLNILVRYRICRPITVDDTEPGEFLVRDLSLLQQLLVK